MESNVGDFMRICGKIHNCGSQNGLLFLLFKFPRKFWEDLSRGLFAHLLSPGVDCPAEIRYPICICDGTNYCRTRPIRKHFILCPPGMAHLCHSSYDHTPWWSPEIIPGLLIWSLLIHRQVRNLVSMPLFLRFNGSDQVI